METSQKLYNFAERIRPIHRSLTGEGVRQTLRCIREELGELEIHEVRSGTQAYDWTVPDEWIINDAYILTPDGDKICSLSDNNLHVVGYSEPINARITLTELKKHLFSLPELPEAIPYVTSYYSKTWGFCISHNQKLSLKEGDYHVVIDSSHNAQGSMTYGELFLPGKQKEEILISTYVCHPEMANNEISGPTISTWLAKHLISYEQRKFSYRFLFIPETIGSIYYISRHEEAMKRNIIGGFNITCVGDQRTYSLMKSRHGNGLTDRAAEAWLKDNVENYNLYSWLDRGSDERQYCSPGIDLKITSLMRSKYHEYPEYHTSLDKLDTLVTKAGLVESLEMFLSVVDMIEKNYAPISTNKCEPMLGKHGLYPTLSTKNTKNLVKNIMNVLSYSDGNRDLIEISRLCGINFKSTFEICESLIEKKLIKRL